MLITKGARYLMVIQTDTQKLAGRITSLTGSFSLERFITYTDCGSLEQVGDAAYQACLCVWDGEESVFFFFF